jgi:hypothetical protein
MMYSLSSGDCASTVKRFCSKIGATGARSASENVAWPATLMASSFSMQAATGEEQLKIKSKTERERERERAPLLETKKKS